MFIDDNQGGSMGSGNGDMDQNKDNTGSSGNGSNQ